MALSGTISDTFCSGVVTLSAEWTLERNYLAGTNKITFKIYLDTSKCHHISTIAATSGESSVRLGLETKNFNTPKITSKGKALLATVVFDDVEMKTSNQTLEVKLSYAAHNLKAYTSLTSYITSANFMSFSKYLTIDGFDRSSKGDVYGTHTLGTENTFNITKQHSDFKHTVAYTCGSVSDSIDPSAVNTTAETIAFTLPVSLSSQNTIGATVSVKFTITTIYSGTTIGTYSFVKTYTMPSSVKPSCSIEVTDAEGLTGKYGGYVQKQSRFKIVVTPTISHGSPIDKYTITANDGTYDEAVNETSLLKNSGSQTIAAMVTDKRGRSSAEVRHTVNVIEYKNPVVSSVAIYRCDEDGTNNYDGEYIKAVFSAEVSPVNNKNSAEYSLIYEESSGINRETVPLTEFDGVYSVTDGVYIFAADKNKSYVAAVVAKDDFGESPPKAAGGSATPLLMHWLASGCGLCFGGLATLENVFENKFIFYPHGGFMFPELEAGKTLHNVRTPNVYIGENADDYEALPPDLSGEFSSIVLPIGPHDDYCYIIISTEPKMYFRSVVNSSLSPWKTISWG